MSEQQPLATCPTCGTNPPPQATFCPTCGTSLSGAPGPGGARPPVSPHDSRYWAMGAHLGAIAGALVGGIAAFVAPLVVWLVRREDDPFAAEHGLESLNFNLTVLLVMIVGVILGFVTVFIGFIVIGPLLLVVGVLWLIFTIQATVAASNGQPYRYPMSIRFISG